MTTFIQIGDGVVASTGTKTAGITEVGRTGPVVIVGDTCRPGSRGVIVKDQGFSRVFGEVDDNIGTFGGHEGKAGVLNDPDPEGSGVSNIGDRLGLTNRRCGQEAGIGTNLNEAGAPVAPTAIGEGSSRIRDTLGTTIDRPEFRPARGHNRIDHFDFGFGVESARSHCVRARQRTEGGCLPRNNRAHIGRSRVGFVDGQVHGAVVTGIKNAETIGFGLNIQPREGGAINDDRVEKGFHPHGRMGRRRNQGRLARGRTVGKNDRIAAFAIGVVIGVGDGRIGNHCRRIEPGAIHPAPKGVNPT